MPSDDRSAALLAQIQQFAAAGNIDAAEAACRELLEQSPDEPEAWSWKGLLATTRVNTTDAIAAYRQAIQLNPRDPNYWTYLSAALRNSKQLTEAESTARRAIEIDATQPTYWTNLAATLRDRLEWSESIAAYRQALALDSANAATWQALAVVEQADGNFVAAQEAFERALAIAPGGEATIGYSYLFAVQNQPQRALLLLHDYLVKKPHSGAAWMVLAHSLKLMNEWQRAEAAVQQSLQLAPKLVEARQLLVEILHKRWALSEAEATAKALVADDDLFSPGWAMLGFVQTVSGQADAAKPTLRHALAIDPHPHHHGQLLCALQYSSGMDAKQLRTAHEAWDASWGSGLPDQVNPWPRLTVKQAKLKLGFVSSDFFKHPVGYLVLPALENLDRSRCSITCYSDRSAEDEYTARFRAVSQSFHNTYCQTTNAVERRIRDDEIDVLFDLTGHWGERMTVFARKPAPIQITWLGYVGTTGLQAMDYLLADRFHVPPGEENAYVEKILRMPQDYICYEPPNETPAVTPPPATSGLPFTFGSFNHPAKLTPPIISAWGEILRRVPRSRLLLKYGGLDDPGMQRRILEVLTQQGIDPNRIQFEGWTDNPALMAAYGRVDLALDPQPYSGGLTTCEALWMGVPVVTWPGKTFAGRHATSHLTHAGVPQFIASSREAYIDLAVEWTSRIDELAALRATLRDQVRASPLCNAKKYAHDLLELLQAIHNEPRT